MPAASPRRAALVSARNASGRRNLFCTSHVGVHATLGSLMSDADQLRNRATRLLALALKVRDYGLSEYADELTQLASEAFDQAADMERRLVSDPKTPL
jgi:hypothetical protein